MKLRYPKQQALFQIRHFGILTDYNFWAYSPGNMKDITLHFGDALTLDGILETETVTRERSNVGWAWNHGNPIDCGVFEHFEYELVIRVEDLRPRLIGGLVRLEPDRWPDVADWTAIKISTTGPDPTVAWLTVCGQTARRRVMVGNREPFSSPYAHG